MKTEIDISGIDKAEILRVLYNKARAQGLGVFQYKNEDLDIKRAKILLSEITYFDYLDGRVMKISLNGDVLNTRLYDRDNGEGAAYEALKAAKLIK